ncbi:hypothetical protein Vadar_021900 [Vaccinium darrowii]|uniref:Uncharacterized protein n=1 Tax=Vaccinium darrowii TaxID=229202 RepID=A0ACB7Y825_9ERIC|nr:hypothetical protein Vadar_021900 [Vaccinium darrowii]
MEFVRGVSGSCTSLVKKKKKLEEEMGFDVYLFNANEPERIYNVVDDDPAPRIEVFSHAWDFVNRKWPGHMKQSVSPYMTQSFTTESICRGEKGVSNARIKEELGVRLLHPSYKSGLKSIVDHM